MNLIDTTTEELKTMTERIWVQAVALTPQQLDDLKHEAGGQKQTNPSSLARLGAHLVEAVCENELAARRESNNQNTRKATT